jgi:hypothetical protein
MVGCLMPNHHSSQSGQIAFKKGLQKWRHRVRVMPQYF